MVWQRDLTMTRLSLMIATCLLFASCAGSGSSFTDWRTEEFSKTAITESATKSFILANPSDDQEQHLLGVAFDRGSNAAGHFRIDAIKVGNQLAEGTDIVVPPGSALTISVTYAPVNLETTQADWGGWVTGKPRRWMPMNPDDYGKEAKEEVVHRAVIQAIYDHPTEGIYYVQVVGKAKPGPHGEEAAGGGAVSCTPGGGTACYTGGFSLDIPSLAPGGPKPLEMTGPIRLQLAGGSAALDMDDFPFIIMYLRSEEVPELPSGVTATLIINGAPEKEAKGTFDGARLALSGVAFRIRVALGELDAGQISQGISAIVDFEVPDLELATIAPLDQGAITLRIEAKLGQNPSGNELFDQFLSGAEIVAVMEGELAL